MEEKDSEVHIKLEPYCEEHPQHFYDSDVHIKEEVNCEEPSQIINGSEVQIKEEPCLEEYPQMLCDVSIHVKNEELTTDHGFIVDYVLLRFIDDSRFEVKKKGDLRVSEDDPDLFEVINGEGVGRSGVIIIKGFKSELIRAKQQLLKFDRCYGEGSQKSSELSEGHSSELEDVLSPSPLDEETGSNVSDEKSLVFERSPVAIPISYKNKEDTLELSAVIENTFEKNLNGEEMTLGSAEMIKPSNIGSNSTVGFKSSVSTLRKNVHQCPQCDYCTPSAGILGKHIRAIHGDDTPYQCPHCEHKSVKPSLLNRHIMAFHTGEKPHHCPRCDYKTTQGGHLKNHIMAVHAGMKPFKCPHCDYKSADAGSLKRHIPAHHGVQLDNVYSASMKHV